MRKFNGSVLVKESTHEALIMLSPVEAVKMMANHTTSFEIRRVNYDTGEFEPIENMENLLYLLRFENVFGLYVWKLEPSNASMIVHNGTLFAEVGSSEAVFLAETEIMEPFRVRHGIVENAFSSSTDWENGRFCVKVATIDSLLVEIEKEFVYKSSLEALKDKLYLNGYTCSSVAIAQPDASKDVIVLDDKSNLRLYCDRNLFLRDRANCKIYADFNQATFEVRDLEVRTV